MQTNLGSEDALHTAGREANAKSTSLLVVEGLSKHFGALRAVDNVSFEVEKGQILAIIGPNGAGKTTAFNCITGVHPATSGKVTFLGQNTLTLPEHKVTEVGIARTFQKIRVFKNLSVLDNVLIGMHCRTRSGVWDALARTPHQRDEEESARRQAMQLLRFVGIDEHWWCLARELAYGDQKRLEVARALAAEPTLLLLDEPVAGMNPAEKDEMVSLVYTIRDRGITVLLVEHDMNVVMGISDKIVVLNHGEKICEGTPYEVQCTEAVVEAYLGRGYQRELARD
jgi:branched-chain amino acid transport system ATP-binding protein